MAYSQWRLNEFESKGYTSSAKRRGKNFVVPLHFLALQVQFFGERFCNKQYSSVSFLFANCSTHGDPRAQPFVIVGRAAERLRSPRYVTICLPHPQLGFPKSILALIEVT